VTSAHRAIRHSAAAALAVVLALAVPVPAQDVVPAQDTGPAPRPEAFAPADEPQSAYDLFAMPKITAALQRMAAHVQAGDIVGAAEIVDALIVEHPTVGLLPASRAALHVLAGETDAAVEGLRTAAALGAADLDRILGDPLFAGLADDPRLVALAVSVPDVPPTGAAPLTGRTARVDGSNTTWDAARGWLEARFDAAFNAADAAPLPHTGAVLGGQRGDAAYEHLRDLVRRGRAAGNHGDLYDNRDRGHSRLPPDNHPQISAVTYGPAARAADVDYGLNDRIRFNLPTLGNSSTALTSGPLWRSQPRAALTRADGTGPWRLYETYAANHVYVYPSHRDVTAERGDLLPANTPYMIVSQGSSGSDRPFLEAVAMILAAFRPDTKERLVEEGLIAPTVQFVFRRSQRSVLSREDYFSGLAHPSAYSAYEIGLARMVSLANAITPETIPPMVRLRVLEEDMPREGIDYFGAGLSEQFFDTPSAIGRVWRGKDYTRTLTVTAEDSADPNDRPLTFHWRLLRGDPDRVRITPLDDGGRARIEIDWQDPRPISKDSPITSARVDIGVFAHNGVHDSAPAMISMVFPAHEARTYAPGPDGAMRVATIDHVDPARARTYVDPMLMARADWRDEYSYDAAGTLTGWQRVRDGRTDAYDAAGHRIVTRDAAGRPARTAAAAYVLKRGRGGVLEVREVPRAAQADPAAAAPAPADPAF
jgi:hypothetical protein